MINPKKRVQDMPYYDPPLEGRRSLMRLDFNENTRGPSPKAMDVLRNAGPELLSAYPEYSKAYERFSSYYGLDKDCILASNGTDESIRLIYNAYVGEGDRVVLPVPTFAIFESESRLQGADLEKVPYNKDLSFPENRLIEQCEDAQLTIIVNPNNPTGTSADISVIEKAVWRSELVLVDEAYAQFSKRTSLDLVKEYDNIIVTRTFSKACGLAGLRLGLAFASPEIISTLKKVSSPYSANALAIECACATLDDDEYVASYIDEVKKSRERLTKGLADLGLTPFRSDANFVLCKVGKDVKSVVGALREKGVLVRDRSSYELLEGCLRIGAGTMEETEYVLSALKDILGDSDENSRD